MKTGRLGFGLFILTIGVAWLMGSFGWLPQGWSVMLPYWPVLLILWGLSVMTRQPVVRGLLVAATAIFAAVWFLSWLDPVVDGSKISDQALAVPAASEVKTGQLKFDSGAGEFAINSAVTDRQLLQVASQVSYGSYQLNQTVSDSNLSARVWFQSTRGMMMGMRGWRNTATVSLNPDVAWDVEVNVGAADFSLDATDLALDKAVISAGAAEISLRLGDEAAMSDVTVKAGASDITVAVPQSVGVRVEMSTGLTGHELADLQRTGEGEWSSADYDTAAKKIDLRFEAGVSDIQLDRY